MNKFILGIVLIVSSVSFAQQKAELVKPWRSDFFFNHSLLSKNGKYVLLTGSESYDHTMGEYKSMLVDLERRKVIKSFADNTFFKEELSDVSLKSEFEKIMLSNKGIYLAGFSEYSQNICLISLRNTTNHKVCNLGEDIHLRNPQFIFSQEDSFLIIYNEDDYMTYFINTEDGTLKSKLKSDYPIDEIWVDKNFLFQKTETSAGAKLNGYNLRDLELSEEILVPSKNDYSESVNELFTNNFFVQQSVGVKGKKIKINLFNLNSKKHIEIEKRLSKIKRKFDSFNLIDVESAANGTELLFVFAFYSEDEIDYQIWSYRLNEDDLKKISDQKIWYMQDWKEAQAKDNVIGLPQDDVLFFLKKSEIIEGKPKSEPFWFGLNNNDIERGTGLEETQEINLVSQTETKTLFGADLWSLGGDHFTEIDLKTGEILGSQFNKWTRESGAYNDEYFIKQFPDYATNVKEYSTSKDSIQNHYYPTDSSFVWASHVVKNNHRDIVINQTHKSVDFFNWKKNNDRRKVSLYITTEGEYIFFTPDRYYMISSKLGHVLYFQMNLKTYPFEQFDLKYNRPDIILDRLGYADSSLITAYHAAYQKRLKKMGFTEDMLEDDFHLPEIKIENFETMPTIIDEDNIDLNLHLEDSKYKLDRVNVWVNDVAIYGTDGISLRDLETQVLDKTINVELAKGKNKVQVSVLNQAGAESYKETFEVKCSVGKKKPDLYLITIGESEFKQSDYNLTYAAKDAEDIASLLPKSKVYDEVFTKTLTNDQVTRENVIGLTSFLNKADINDHVMIFLAGHGVLSAHLDYYLATYDMDFTAPEERGLMYEDLEGLLDGIKPLKKTLILDACHSGEIDKEEVELASAENTFKGDVQFRSVGKSVKSKLGAQNTLELTRSLFTDLRKGTGATVISSAGGMEFAMEGDDWNNGLFTYALLNGIKSGEADLNGDKEIWLSELKEYVGHKVTELSNGKQQPTSRIENQTVDFRVW